MSEVKFNPTSVASYGAALSTAMLATGVDAAVISLNANPSTLANSATIFGAGSNIVVTGGVSFSFSMDNSSFFGRNIYGRDDIANVYQGVLFSLGNFSSSLTEVTGSNVFLDHSFVGQQFVNFVTSGGNLGYIEFDFLANGDAKFVSIFANDEPGAPIGVGKGGGPDGVIPVPASLPIMATGMLALGAVGLRKRRKAKSAA